MIVAPLYGKFVARLLDGLTDRIRRPYRQTNDLWCADFKGELAHVPWVRAGH